MSKAKRSDRIVTYLAYEDLRKLDQLVELTHMTRSEFVRELIIRAFKDYKDGKLLTGRGAVSYNRFSVLAN